MPLATNFNVNPYYDDYNEDKKFLKILFKPGYAVQARELTQIQSIIQKQIERFGNNIFINGRFISGGQTFYQNCISLKLDSTYASTSILASNFSKTTIFNNALTKRAEVIVAIDADSNSGDPITLLINQLYGDPFVPGEIIKTSDSLNFATISSTLANSVGVGQTFSISEGVIYYSGFFIKVDSQSIAISKYDTNSASLKVGFDINEYSIKSTDDVSLIDPAQEASNYQAPGADRYKVELILSTRTLDNVDDLTNFIELARYNLGSLETSNKPSVYNTLGEELAKRTYEESGNYVVTPFKITADANTTDTSLIDLTVGTGKAYVRGYEIASNADKKISIPAARTNSSNNSYNILGNYGNYLLITNLINANNLNINQLGSIDFHCVTSSNISLTTAGLANTRIGTANLKCLDYVSTSNSLNGYSTVYAASLFNVNVSNLVANVQTGGDSVNVKLGSGFSSVNNAYTGATLRIITGPGSTESLKTITYYDGVTKNATVSPAFSTTPTSSSVYSIEFNTKNISSIATTNSTGFLAASADISTQGINPYTISTSDPKTLLFENSKEELVFSLPITYPVSIPSQNVSYQYDRQFSAAALTANVITISSIDSDKFFDLSTLSTNVNVNERNYYKIVCVNKGTSGYANGQIIPSTRYSISLNPALSQSTITVTDGQNMTVDITATMVSSSGALKSKTFVPANTSNISSAAGLTVVANKIFTYGSDGQTHISQNSIIRTPETDQVLYLVDAIRLVKVLDFANNAINDTNMPSAIDVTSRYKLETGQRDSYYDFSSIRLKAGETPPVGPIAVFVDRFTHPFESPGYFSVSSYPDAFYSNGSTFISSSGQGYRLRDCLDFRPSIKESSAPNKVFNIPSTGPKIIKKATKATINYESYLPRVDKLILNSDGKFFVLSGVPSLNPRPPKNNDDSIALYEIKLPPYTNQSANLIFDIVPNKRYTMQDIGNLEKRIKSLEYYATLSLLENDAMSKSDPSLYGRSKNGIITDSFTGLDVLDPNATDFRASINVVGKELRPSPVEKDFDLKYYGDISTNIIKNGSLIFLKSNANVVFTEQNKFTAPVSVNPFNVQNFIGSLRLIPQSDIWVDTETLPDLIIQDAGNNNQMQVIAELNKINQNIIWGAWYNSGSATETSFSNRTYSWHNDDWWYHEHYETMKISQPQHRTGQLIQYQPETVLTSLGEQVVKTEVIPYIRERRLLFKLSSYRPSAYAYPYIDNTNFINNTSLHNIIKINDTVTSTSIENDFSIVSSQNPDLAVRRCVLSNSSQIIGNCSVTNISGKTLYVTDVKLNDGWPVNWNSGLIKIRPSNSTGAYYNLSTSNAYTHFSGNVNTVTYAATTSTFRLAPDANNASFYADNIVGNVVRIVHGPAKNQSSIISAYDISTRVVTLSTPLTTIPASNSIYQIGDIRTDERGKLAGSLYIPGGVYRTGERKFRFTDQQTGDFSASSTRAESSYYAQGTIETKQETIISSIQPKKIILPKSDDQIVTTYKEYYRNTTREPYDPVSQTFFVSAQQHPDGIFLSKIRLCFANKDSTIPVNLELRPTVNGVPSATEAYPFSEVSLLPDQVKTTVKPNFDDSNEYTEFVFESPVHLLPGEHSFVVSSNSNLYEVWTAKKDENDIVTGNKVDTQPAVGSFFASQNGSTWSAEQERDMSFRIYYHQFDTSVTGQTFFELQDNPTSNVYADIIIAQSQQILFGNTSLSFAFKSEKNSDGLNTLYLPIIPRTEYYMSDGFGRRIFNPASGNNTFSLRTTMATSNPDVSPILDIERFGVKAIEQRLNNLSLSNSDIVVSNTGSYANGSNITVTITGGAVAVANVVKAYGTNTIDKIIITNGGSNYTTSPTITISGGAPIYSAVASVNGENKRRGGNALCRYMTKRVTLADGFNSGDLRVYLTAHKPADSSILVYYKVMSAGDLDNWQDKEWKLMTQIDKINYYSKNIDDFEELTFAPGTNNLPDNYIEYSSISSGQFNDFNTFAIKIVMAGVNTVDVPRVKDFRAIAIPSV